MNNLVRKLADQAIAHANQTWNPDSEPERFVLIAMEKHAELIIQECIRCCDDVDTIQKHYEKYHLDMELDASQCIEVIKKHFGIE